MIEIIDTHSHIYCSAFDEDRSEVIDRAKRDGISHILLPAVDSESHDAMLALADSCDICTPMMGVHPTTMNNNPSWREELLLVERYLKEAPAGRFCAVGEIGLDLYWSKEFRDQQVEAFTYQIDLALLYDLPVVIHARDAWEQTIEIIERYKGRGLRGVFHAFSGDLDIYNRLKQCGDFVFGIGGVVTFKKIALADVVRQMDLCDIVLETDSPYLTPAPYRGKRNESQYTIYICDKIAELKGMASREVAAQTTVNAKRIFNL